MARFCNNCNYPIEDGGSFCSECGSSDIRDTSGQPITPSSSSLDDIKDMPQAIPEIVPLNSGITSEPIHEPGMDINPKTPETEPKTEPEPTYQSSEHVYEEIPMPKDIMRDDRPGANNGSFADVPSYMNGESKKNLVDLSVKAQNANVQRPTKKKGGSGVVVGVICILLVVLGAIGGFIFYGDKLLSANGKAVVDGPFKTEDLYAAGNATPAVDYSTIFTPQNSFRVGTASYGYISIPNTWVQFKDVDGNATLQYTDNGTWIVTLYAMPTTSISAVTWANNVYNNLQNDGVQNLSTSKTTINSYTALTINAYYPTQNKYLTTYFLESKNGTSHYLAIEGPANTGDNFNIIYSFKENE